MTPAEVVWLAGLLEGEATFDLHRGRYPRVRVGMVDRDIVERAAQLLGCSVRLSLRPAPQSAMWHAEVSGPKAEAVMRAILPHMGARRSARIAQVLGHVPTPGPTVPLQPAATPAGTDAALRVEIHRMERTGELATVLRRMVRTGEISA